MVHLNIGLTHLKHRYAEIRTGPWACGTKFSKRAPRLNDLTFQNFQKKEGGGGGGTQGCRYTFEKGRGEVVSIVGLKKKGGGSYTHANGKK